MSTPNVEDLSASIAFYSKRFAAQPTRVENDYAKWMLDDPRINFAISTRGGKPGVDHLGFQTDTDEEVAELKARAQDLDLVCQPGRRMGAVFSDTSAGIAPASVPGFVAAELVGTGVGVALHRMLSAGSKG